MICRIEGDKAIDEVEAFDEGILRIPPSSPSPGAKVPVGTLLAYLVQPGERAPFEAEEAGGQESGDRCQRRPLTPDPCPLTPQRGGTDNEEWCPR